MVDDNTDARTVDKADDRLVAGSMHTMDAVAVAQGEHFAPVELVLADTVGHKLDLEESWMGCADLKLLLETKGPDFLDSLVFLDAVPSCGLAAFLVDEDVAAEELAVMRVALLVHSLLHLPQRRRLLQRPPPLLPLH